MYRFIPSRRRFHRFRDELRRSESRRGKLLPCQAGPAYAALFCLARRARLTQPDCGRCNAPAPSGNSLCYRKHEFPIVWDRRINKSDIGPEKVWRMVCLLSQRSAALFCSAGRARLTQPDCGRCNAPAPSGNSLCCRKLEIPIVWYRETVLSFFLMN